MVATPTAQPAEANTDTYRNIAPAAPAPTAWVADPQLVQSGDSSVSTFDPPAGAVRYCATFGGDADDWRNFDAMYQTSPACKK